MVKAIFFGVVTVFWFAIYSAATSTAAPPHQRAGPRPVTFEGTWDCHGLAMDGQPYKAQLTIKPEGKGYTFEWADRDTKTVVYLGVGFLEGDALMVAFWGSRWIGIGVYRVKEGGLEGRWSGLESLGQIQAEACVPFGSREV